MSSSNSPHMQRSFSMPGQPEPLPTKTMKRSQEKETLYEEDYYPESPNLERRRKSNSEKRERFAGTHSVSDNNITSGDWAGSTIELNNDLRRNETDTIYHRRKPYRVIEKNGRENVIFKRIPEKSWRYIRDFVTTLVRFLLPKRFLMNSKTTESTTSTLASSSAPNLTNTVNTTSTPTTTAQTTTVTSHSLPSLTKKGEETEGEGLNGKLNQSEVKFVNSDDKKVEDDKTTDYPDSCQKDDRRVKFSLFD